ncbi:uncharacterized protein CLUP02_17428 [Colletotrichum lupini]|uniref:Uncharacterized protein n=1 Tax=Colletotrichum lupini TaxID=145971 RepID=A0A9Q8SEI9_9PEZI|nr:uncharacterized protein CLUP02_17428 [Colletotrichum lupini]UQC75919.1 hypothetical protein CLUP02_17428 [Colletotrichum lupini]
MEIDDMANYGNENEYPFSTLLKIVHQLGQFSSFSSVKSKRHTPRACPHSSRVGHQSNGIVGLNNVCIQAILIDSTTSESPQLLKISIRTTPDGVSPLWLGLPQPEEYKATAKHTKDYWAVLTIASKYAADNQLTSPQLFHIVLKKGGEDARTFHHAPAEAEELILWGWGKCGGSLPRGPCVFGSTFSTFHGGRMPKVLEGLERYQCLGAERRMASRMEVGMQCTTDNTEQLGHHTGRFALLHGSRVTFRLKQRQLSPETPNPQVLMYRGLLMPVHTRRRYIMELL